MSLPPPSQAKRIAIVGGGPAGLRAAEVAAGNGARVTVFDSQGAVGRKFLLAGRSGLNLTHDEPLEEFLERYDVEPGTREHWRRILAAFDPDALRRWAHELGVETFVSKGKVLPTPVKGRMRATPLLRNWLERLRNLGVEFRLRHRWTGMDGQGRPTFVHGDETLRHETDRTILALGGGSWPSTGSDGAWQQTLEELGVARRELQPSNCGWETDWPPALLEEAEGQPLKGVLLRAGDKIGRGDLVITRYGLEGPPIYRLGPALRRMKSPRVQIDFKPDVPLESVRLRLGKVRRNFVREARRRLNLGVGAAALLKHLPDRGPWRDGASLAQEIKACELPLLRPRPLAEAISSAGGLAWSELDEGLQLKRLPGVYAAGEMLDWDAPTGGYLLQGCFATGDLAGRSASLG